MQVPIVSPLSQGAARNGHLVNKSVERRAVKMDEILNLSHPKYSVKFLKMTWKKLDCSASQVGGAENIFCELFGDQKAKNSFWLDSSSIEKVLSSPACCSFSTLHDSFFGCHPKKKNYCHFCVSLNFKSKKIRFNSFLG